MEKCGQMHEGSKRSKLRRVMRGVPRTLEIEGSPGDSLVRVRVNEPFGVRFRGSQL